MFRVKYIKITESKTFQPFWASASKIHLDHSKSNRMQENFERKYTALYKMC
jgi:hypothetical protein